MKHIPTITNTIKKVPPRYAFAIIPVVLITGFLFFSNGNGVEETITVRPGEFLRQVSVSGKITTTDTVDLSFEQSARISAVTVEVGDHVTRGELLASQDTADLEAQLAEARAGIAVQEARLGQLLAGSSQENIQIAQTAILNAETSVRSAEQTKRDAQQELINTLQDAYTKADDAIFGKVDQLFMNPQTDNPQLSLGAPISSQLEIDLELERHLAGDMLATFSSNVSSLSLSSDTKMAETNAKQTLTEIRSFLDMLALAVNGLAPNSTLSQTTIDKWKGDITTARTNVNAAIASVAASQSRVETAQAGVASANGALDAANDQLALAQAPARASDIALYKAQVAQAEAGASNILAQLEKKRIYSPLNGTVTVVNAKVGSIMGGNEPAIALISKDTLQIESYVPEVHIPLIAIGDQAQVTLDAYGEETLFTAHVISIDPAETVRDGISTYRVKLQLAENSEAVKPGMTGNVVITTEKKDNVISVPQRIITEKDGKKFVPVKKGETTETVEVTTGDISSFGTIEILSGLQDGDVVVVAPAQQ